ncbi:MAG: glycosyl transferase, partial [Actinomycetes bacterium]
LSRAVEFLESNPGVVAVTGEVLRDGAAEKREIPGDTASLLLVNAQPAADAATATRHLYGCNFVVRYHAALSTRFDDRLPLYGWLEDRDFAGRVKNFGALAHIRSAQIVHRGAQSGGRLSHRRFGYSQVANPIHLWRKGSITLGDCVGYLLRSLPNNLARSAVGRDAQWRRARVSGNAAAVLDLMTGRLAPERILRLVDA